MNALTPDQERKLLQDLLRDLQDPPASLRKQRRLNLALRLAALALLLLAILQGFTRDPSALLMLIPGVIGGVLTGIAVLQDQMLQQWPATAPHVDQASVQRRLDELQAAA